MLEFDRAVIGFLNSFARHSTTFDQLVAFVARSHLPKGDVVLGVYWWIWFRSEGSGREDRAKLVAALGAGFVSLFLGRVLATTLPFRLRPLHDSGLGFVTPYGGDVAELRGWSAFPSDHAMMYFALATGMLFVSRKAGLFLLAHAVVFVSLPRVYMGLHFPSDVLGGAVIGIAAAMVANLPRVREALSRRALDWLERKPASFYGCAFMLSILVASMFREPRELFDLLTRLLAHRFGRQ